MCPHEDRDPSAPRPERAVYADARRERLDLARARADRRRLARLRHALASIFIATGATAAALSWSGFARTSQIVAIPALVLGVTAATVAPLVVWALYKEWQNDRRTEDLLTLVQLHPDEGQAPTPRAAT